MAGHFSLLIFLQLKELFAFQLKSAKIARHRKFEARGESAQSRCFGFVTLTSEEMQKKVIEEMNGILVDGCKIFVKAAIDMNYSDDVELFNIRRKLQSHTSSSEDTENISNGKKASLNAGKTTEKMNSKTASWSFYLL